MAFSKLESRLRRAGDRRKCRHGAHAAVRLIDLPVADDATVELPRARPEPTSQDAAPDDARSPSRDAAGDSAQAANVVPLPMPGDAPPLAPQKLHPPHPTPIPHPPFPLETHLPHL